MTYYGDSNRQHVLGSEAYIPDENNAISEDHIKDGAVTAGKLGDDITIDATVDDVTIEINGDGDIAIKDNGVDTSQLADAAVGLTQLASEVTDLLDIISAIPTEDPADDGLTIWNNNGVLQTSGPST